MSNYHTYIATPVGVLKLIATEKGLAAVLWENDDATRVTLSEGIRFDEHPVLVETTIQLQEYFAKKRKVFDLPLDFIGTAFQQQIWQQLLKIPYGEARSYGDLAREIANEKSVRAVGGANGKNPISIIAPCHRVIGTSGKLTGFAGGLRNKAFLLALERSQTQPTLWDEE